ncbi:aminodeoxychorismate/anthranilate synthase component II [Colwellia sp. UCD-KL20]|uniref:aminodeoxychorismate/anthranilate synthase component II n=1 Tax=Colwellia sp. UCD-KL20 TaxID=1917165 RepID=UPI000970B011|nr:aminodeoxychorismate/anthranilate synthase component II [Colwellia sp. UCD-KL20]
MTSLNKALPETLPTIIMLDNLDSFTYNLVDEFQCLGYEPLIYRNTLPVDYILEQLNKEANDNPQGVILVLSPGPGDPSHAGCLMELIAKTVGQFPILGICLGHQALIQHYGGVIGRAPEIVHGKSSNVEHTSTGAFLNIANPLPVARYHSLVAIKMPDTIEMIAQFTTDNNDVLPMAVQHSKDAVLGFQFHPESILTTYGSHLLAQSLEHLIALNQQKAS